MDDRARKGNEKGTDVENQKNWIKTEKTSY